MKGREHLENLRKDGKVLKLISQNKDEWRKLIEIRTISDCYCSTALHLHNKPTERPQIL